MGSILSISLLLCLLCFGSSCVTSKAAIRLPDGGVVEVQTGLDVGPKGKPKAVRMPNRPTKKVAPLDCYYNVEGDLYYEREGKYCPYKEEDYQMLRLLRNNDD